MKSLRENLKLITPSVWAIGICYVITFGVGFSYSVVLKSGLEKGVSAFFAGVGIATATLGWFAVSWMRAKSKASSGKTVQLERVDHEKVDLEPLKKIRTVFKWGKLGFCVLAAVCFMVVCDSRYLPGLLNSRDLEYAHRGCCMMLIFLPLFFLSYVESEKFLASFIQRNERHIVDETAVRSLSST